MVLPISLGRTLLFKYGCDLSIDYANFVFFANVRDLVRWLIYSGN